MAEVLGDINATHDDQIANSMLNENGQCSDSSYWVLMNWLTYLTHLIVLVIKTAQALKVLEQTDQLRN